MAWLQQQPTRERPDTFTQLSSCLVQEPCTDGADHTFFASRSFSAALSNMASAKSLFFSRAFSLSGPFRRLASVRSSLRAVPPCLTFREAIFDRLYHSFRINSKESGCSAARRGY
jgi:hypothetical protein